MPYQDPNRDKLMAQLLASINAVDESPAEAIQAELLGSEPTGDSAYSSMGPEDQGIYDEYAFNYFNDQYENRDLGKFGRLDFESYIAGLTPDEGFITALSKMAADDTTQTPATTWMEIFGENTDDMRAAAMKGSNY